MPQYVQAGTTFVRSKVRFAYVHEASNITLRGTGQSVTSMTFIRLGDT